MKKFLRVHLRSLVLSCLLLLASAGAYANHLVGADLFYTWVSGSTYNITVILYGDCGSPADGTGSTSFYTLPTSTPRVCIYNGNTLIGHVDLPIQAPSAGVEITPVCPADSDNTQCTNLTYTIPGIKKFVYTTSYTFPTTSHNWRLVYEGYNGTGAVAGRALAITNILSGTTIQLIDTLDNTYHHNSNPTLTVVPTPFFCLGSTDCYNPGAVDIDGDSLTFALIPATSGSGSGTCPATFTTPTSVTYTAGTSAAAPLQTTAGSFSFDPGTGQICFVPSVTQRSVVVYNVREYRNDTFIGTCQREMTFKVLTCTNIAPSSGAVTTTGIVAPDDTTDTHFHVCGNAGAFCIDFNPTEPDTSNHITVTATGYAGTGLTFTALNNGTNHPNCSICGDASTMPPGPVTIFITMQDDNCPLTGIKTIAYTINVYPVPTISYSLITGPTCLDKGIVSINPGGTGKPWTIKVSNPVAPFDTIQTFVDSLAFPDTLAPGTYNLTVFTSVSNQCNAYLPMVIDPPGPFPITTDHLNPSYCGASDGRITIHGLATGTSDTIRYSYNGVVQTPITAAVVGDSALLTGLHAGIYDPITVSYGYCTSADGGPDTLVNPVFPIGTLTSKNPSKCGFCDGQIVLYGLHIGQQDTIYYNYNGVGQSTPYYIGTDSVIFSGLCAGSYTGFFARTDSTCNTAVLAGVTLTAPPIVPAFDTAIHPGCYGDTVYFTNGSSPATDLTYHWDFGDGTTSVATSPVHVYTNTTNMTYTVKLYISNTKCVDSFIMPITLNNYVHASFTIAPVSNFICQNMPDTITNTTTGTDLSYTWYYGDGTSDNTSSATFNHTYSNTGVYHTILIAKNGTSCFDTTEQIFYVDSISSISLAVTDSVICSGQGSTFTASYAHIGDTGNTWTFSDGLNINNVNSVMHAFIADPAVNPSIYTVTVTALYRACPPVTTSRTVTVFGYPHVDLGPDTSICPGGNPILLADYINVNNESGARWQWSTNETTPGITVVKPGDYTLTVTINGCSASDTVIVLNDCYMNIPNVFTPNGDGTNDYFFPRQFLSKGVTSFKMNIYNRWGQLIFQTSSTDGLGWDGAFNNVQQPEGVYVYIIDATFKDGQIEHHQGNVTLLR